MQRGPFPAANGRRQWLSQCAASAFGVGVGQFLESREGLAAAFRGHGQGPGFGRAKSCIVLFLFGAPAHQDTWDLKPDAPLEVRGEFHPIATSVPDVTVSEHLPLCSQRMHRFTQIRSVTHPDNTHTVAMHYMLSGVRHKRPATNPQNAADDFPCYGAVMNYFDRQRPVASRRKSLPAGVSLNAPANQVSANNHIFPGFFAGFLGTGYDPLFLSHSPDALDFAPFPTTDATSRITGRRHLLSALDASPRIDIGNASSASVDQSYERAFDLLTSSDARAAFDLRREPSELRQRYGMTPFGQGCLLARRLMEAAVPLVTVNWQRDDAFWDTHADNFNLHKNKLLPVLDQALSALVDDLAERGRLEETLIIALGEFGRTPKINPNAGRDHWAACNTVVLAGAGLPGGYVHGASDRMAAYPTRQPVSPEELAATIYHLLGIPRERILLSPDGRPQPVSTGEPLWPLLG